MFANVFYKKSEIPRYVCQSGNFGNLFQKLKIRNNHDENENWLGCAG